MIPLALAELTQIFRNRSVLITSFVMPIAVSAFFVYQHESFAELASLGYIAAIVVFTVGAFGLYTTVVTTLAARRQNLFLKRLRSTAASDGSILSGLVVPATVISAIQVVGILAVFGFVAGSPADVALFAGGVIGTLAMMLGLGLATAGFTNSPEHAQVTTLPVSLGTIAVASWVGISGTEELTLLKRLLPGGSATELMTDAWNGGAAVGDSLMLLAPTAAWVVVAVVLAATYFRWEPRR